jgi:hypothetical protein
LPLTGPYDVMGVRYDPVKVGSFKRAVRPAARRLAVADIIKQDEQDVWPLIIRRKGRRHERNKSGENGQGKFHRGLLEIAKPVDPSFTLYCLNGCFYYRNIGKNLNSPVQLVAIPTDQIALSASLAAPQCRSGLGAICEIAESSPVAT